MKRRRVFQIGFNRCGTMSLARLFEASGWKTAHWLSGRLAAHIELARLRGLPLLSYVDEFEVFTDMEVRELAKLRGKWFKPRVFRHLLATRAAGDDAPIYAYKYFDLLDAQYPGSKFVLNTRDIDRWVASRFGFKADYRACVHGDGSHPDPSELVACWKRDWHQHHQRVRDYFADRPRDLLELDIERDPIERLAEFLAPAPVDLGSWGQHNSSGSAPPRQSPGG